MIDNEIDYKRLFDEALERWRQRRSVVVEPDDLSMGFKAALIDMDGTLYDSMPGHTLAWQRMAAEIGIDIPRERFYLFEGMTGAATIDLIFREKLGRSATDEEKVELYKRKSLYFSEMPQVSPMPGAVDMLQSLRERGIERVLVTGSGQKSLIDRILHDFPGLFAVDKMVTSADVIKGKPDPEPYFRGMEKAGSSAVDSMVIENAPLGVKSGAASGAFTIALTTGPIPREEMVNAGADIVLPSMECLARVMALD